MTEKTIPTPEEVGKRIRIQVDRYNMTVAKAAALCNLSQASFETFLHGKKLPDGVELFGLSNGLRCSAPWLLTGEASA